MTYRAISFENIFFWNFINNGGYDISLIDTFVFYNYFQHIQSTSMGVYCLSDLSLLDIKSLLMLIRIPIKWVYVRMI